MESSTPSYNYATKLVNRLQLEKTEKTPESLVIPLAWLKNFEESYALTNNHRPASICP